MLPRLCKKKKKKDWKREWNKKILIFFGHISCDHQESSIKLFPRYFGSDKKIPHKNKTVWVNVSIED